MKFLNQSKSPIHNNPIYFTSQKNDVTVECSLQWTDAYHENTLCFTNNITQRDGGTHLAGFRGALTRSIVNYINAKSKTNINVSGDDAREGLTCVISVKLPDPKFSSQTKEKTICFSKGGKYFKPPSGLGYKLFDGETDNNKSTTNYVTICHENSSACDTANNSFDLEKKYDAYLVRYSRFGLITKYRWDFNQTKWIGY